MKDVTSKNECRTYKVEIKGLPAGFLVDIFKGYDSCIKEYVFEAWFYHKDYGIKESMFGIPEKQSALEDKISFEEMEKIVESNLINDVHFIKAYYEEHMEWNEKIEKYIYSHPEKDSFECPLCGCTTEKD